MQVTSTPAVAATSAAAPRLLNEPGDVIGTAKRVPFTHTMQLRYGPILAQFDQLYDAEQSALKLSDGDKPAVVISSFPAKPEGDELVETERYVLYGVDYAKMTRPLNPMTHPTVVEQGTYHHGLVTTFGYESKDHSWDLGAAQYIVDDGKTFDIENLEQRD